MSQMKYGEREIKEFDIEEEAHFWPNENRYNYTVKITLPEFMAKCPRSGYPDFGTLYLHYIPGKKVIELKALKLYINSFADRYISHENVVNEIFETLYEKLSPHWMKLTADFEPRGNVHTLIELDSDTITKYA